MTHPSEFPLIAPAGIDGLVVRFSDALSEPANRAALAFRAAVEREGWDGVEESATALTSVYLRFDPAAVVPAAVAERLRLLLAAQDWYAAALPEGRRRWRVPTLFGGDAGPQLETAAAQAGLDRDTAIATLTERPLRVQTIGFAPGQPYLGELPQAWDIPRQTDLTPRVPEGAVTVAIRQIVLFAISSPTGWWHVGQTKLRLFRPEAEVPFLLRPGDEVQFDPVDAERFARLGDDPQGGAVSEMIR